MPRLPKKNPAYRNTSTTKRRLREAPAAVKPSLPAREEGWHKMTLQWWEAVWDSPMADEYVDADVPGLIRMAALVNDFWEASSPSARIYAAAEIRHQSQAFGLTPIDRRRLQWEIGRGEEAERKTRAKRAGKPAGDAKDPRQALSAAK